MPATPKKNTTTIVQRTTRTLALGQSFNNPFCNALTLLRDFLLRLVHPVAQPLLPQVLAQPFFGGDEVRLLEGPPHAQRCA